MKRNNGKGVFDSCGQTVIEASVAFVLLIIVLSAVVVVVVASVSNAAFTKNQNLANRYAQDGMEYLRDLERNRFDMFDELLTGIYCMDENYTMNPCGGNPPLLQNTFRREVSIQKNAPECKDPAPRLTRVIISVSWLSAKCPNANPCHKAEIVSCFKIKDPAKVRL